MLISDCRGVPRRRAYKAVWTGDVARVNAGFTEVPEVESSVGAQPAAPSSNSTGSPADFAGQKFRMPSNPIHVGLAENLGASAQVIPLGELFTALETGVVDGQDNGMVTVVSEGLYEVQQYVYETNHIIATLEIIVNEAFLSGLTEEQQTIRDAARPSEQAWDDTCSIDEDRQF